MHSQHAMSDAFACRERMRSQYLLCEVSREFPNARIQSRPSRIATMMF